MADESIKIYSDDNKLLGHCALHKDGDAVKDDRKVYCGYLKVMDAAKQEIATVEFKPDITVIKFPDGTQKPLKSPYNASQSVVFFAEEHFNQMIAASFMFTIIREHENRANMLKQLEISCVSPLKHQRLAAAVPITQQHDNSPADELVRKFPPDFSLN